MSLQLINLIKPTTPQNSPSGHVTIETRDHWLDVWRPVDNAVLEYVTWACSPSSGKAQFSRRYGLGIQPDDNQERIYPPLDLNRKQVRIQLYAEDATQWSVQQTWIGIVDIAAEKQDGTIINSDVSRVITGSQTFAAYGMEFLLERHRIHRSRFTPVSLPLAGQDDAQIVDQDGNPIGAQEEITEVQQGITFNPKGKGNRSLDRSRDPEFGVTAKHFEFEYHENGQPTWSTRDIVEYLVRSGVGVPKFPEDVVEGFPDSPYTVWSWRIDDEDLDRLPTWDVPEIETHLITTKQILDTLISRRRLLTWWVEVDETMQELKIRVATMTNEVLQLGPAGDQINRNDDWVWLSYEEEAALDAVVQMDTSHTVDQVIAYGGKVTSTFTTTIGDDWKTFVASTSSLDIFHPVVGSVPFLKSPFPACLEDAWEDTDEDDYGKGGSDDPSYPSAFEIDPRRKYLRKYRSQERFQQVYKTFRMDPRGFIPQENPGKPFLKAEFAALEEGTSPFGEYAYTGDVVFMPRLPLREGIDYGGDKIATGMFAKKSGVEGDDPFSTEFREPMLVAPVVQSETSQQVVEYIRVDQLGQGVEVEPDDPAQRRDWHITTRVPKDGRTFTMDVIGAPQHTIAKEHFDDIKQPEDLEEHGHWDFCDWVLTITAQTGTYASAAYPESVEDFPAQTQIRTMRIPAGDNYRMDFVEPSTIVDVIDGKPVATQAGGYVRNDYEKLQAIAKQAWYWYSKQRNSIRARCNWNREPARLALGQYVQKLVDGNGEDFIDINGIITELTVEGFGSIGEEPRSEPLPPLQLTFQTSFGELDYLRLKDEK